MSGGAGGGEAGHHLLLWQRDLSGGWRRDAEERCMSCVDMRARGGGGGAGGGGFGGGGGSGGGGGG